MLFTIFKVKGEEKKNIMYIRTAYRSLFEQSVFANSQFHVNKKTLIRLYLNSVKALSTLTE